MKKKLFWTLFAIIAGGTVLLFAAVDTLSRRAEQQMSQLSEPHRRELRAWGEHAHRLFKSGREEELSRWLETLMTREDTWAAIVRADLTPLAGSYLSSTYMERFRLGRDADWKIHLYFTANPVMSTPFDDGQTYFLIRLPQRMRPGTYLPVTQILLQIALPFVLLSALTIILYRYLMHPLRQLETAAHAFSEGNYTVRIRDSLGRRNDELGALADTFDHMASRIGELIINQRQLIADLSHELRTPLARMDMAIDCLEQDIKSGEARERLRRDNRYMRHLVEDALTLAWMQNEEPTLTEESVDLAELLQIIVDDAGFEYPDRHIVTDFPDTAPLSRSSHRALAQATENIVRNALRYTPPGKTVAVAIHPHGQGWRLTVTDEGPGVPEQHLKSIFRPFFRVQQPEPGSDTPARGYGLGLALAERQIRAVKGHLSAGNRSGGGLEIVITLPG